MKTTILHLARTGWLMCSLAALPLCLHAQPYGQWDFNNSNLVATVGTDLAYLDGPGGDTQTETLFGLTSDFGLPPINGVHARVMAFPAAVEPKGFLIPTPPANGRGSKVNEFTLVMDIYYPAASHSTFRRIMQLSGFMVSVTTENGLSLAITNSEPHGVIASDTWYRLGWVVNLTEHIARFYINGLEVGEYDDVNIFIDADGSLPALSQVALLCNTGLTGRAGYVNSIQLWDRVLTSDELFLMGGPSADGLPVVPPKVLVVEDFDSLPLIPKVEEPNIDPSLVGWGQIPPAGWSIDYSLMPGVGTASDGRTEWAGWSFATKEFWLAADQQTRELFTLGTGTIAIADPDEWDDGPHPREAGDYFDSILATPEIDIAGIRAGTLKLRFDSSWRPECCDNWGGALNNQTATISVSYDGGAYLEVLRWDSQPSSSTFKPDAQNETVEVPLNNPAGASWFRLYFRLSEAANDWWWAIDNVTVYGTPILPRVQYSPNKVTLVFSGTPGPAYDVQRADTATFPTGSWTTLTTGAPVIATADRLVIYHDTSPPPGGALYRIVPR